MRTETERLKTALDEAREKINLQSKIIDTIRGERDDLRADLEALRAETFVEGAFSAPIEWKLTPYEEKFFSVLLSCKAATKDRLFDSIYALRADGDIPEMKIVDVYVCKIRKKLRPYGIRIETIWGRGYRIPDEIREKLKKEYADFFVESAE